MSAPARAQATRLRAHFARAVTLLEERSAHRTDFKEWRGQARGDGLDPRALVKLAREHLREADQHRRAAEQAEVEELYRQGLGLPLFGGRA
jgi:uncharacterized protein (UPF0335 family)